MTNKIHGWITMIHPAPKGETTTACAGRRILLEAKGVLADIVYEQLLWTHAFAASRQAWAKVRSEFKSRLFLAAPQPVYLANLGPAALHHYGRNFR